MLGSVSSYLFAPLGKHALGILRICLVSYLSIFELPALMLVLHGVHEIPAEFMNPSIILSILPYELAPESDIYLKVVLELLAALAVFGAFTRLSLVLFSGGWLYLSAVASAWGWHDHGPSLIVQVLLVMAFAPGIDAYSIDRTLRKRHLRGEERRRWLVASNEPAWGLKLILCLIAFFYFASGATKMYNAGFRWLDGNTLGFYLSGRSVSSHIQQYVAVEGKPSQTFRDGIGLESYIYGARPTEFAKHLAGDARIMLAGTIAAVALELFMPLILLGPGFCFVLLSIAATFHIGVYYLMGIPFISWIVLDLCLAYGAFRKLTSSDKSGNGQIKE